MKDEIIDIDTENNQDNLDKTEIIDIASPDNENKELVLEQEKNDAVQEISQSNIDENKSDNQIENNKNENNEETLNANDLKKTKKIKFKLPTISLKHVTSVPKNVCIIGLIVFFTVGLLIGKMFFSKNYCAVTTTRPTENKKFVADGKNNITEVGNFKYQVPNSYIYDKDSNYLLVYDKDGLFKITIRSLKGNYDDLILSKVSIKESVKEQGYVVNDVKELVVNNNNHLVLELTDNTYNHLISFTKGNDEYIFYIDIVTTSNDIDSTILNTAEDIVRNAEYVEKVNALESMRKVDVADISLKAASEYKKATSK